MKGTRRISDGARRHRDDAGLDLRPPRFSRPQFSNRQNPLVESGLSCCKQTLRARSNRQIFRGSANFCFHISNFGDSFRIAIPLVPSKAEGSEHREPRDLSVSFISIRQCFQVESAATHSQQRIGAPAIRQFFGRKGSRVPGKGSLGDQPRSQIYNLKSRLSRPRNECQAKPADSPRKSFKTNDRRPKQVSIFRDLFFARISIFKLRSLDLGGRWE